jgi:hypothetical protein
LEHGELVAQDRDLNVLAGVATTDPDTAFRPL